MRANILDRRGFAMAVAVAFTGTILAVFPAVFLSGGGPAAAQTPPAPVVAAPTPDPGPGPVTRGNLFTAAAVPVDVTAGSVTEARERGLTQGRVAGFRKVLSRIVMREDMDRLPQLSSTLVIDMVRDFSIANERSSAVRYLADLSVRFDPAAIRRLLRNANIPYTETLSKPLVVVPLIRENATAPWQLWEDSNTWRAAWAVVPKDLGLVPLVVPTGGRDDSAVLTATQAAARDLIALNALARRYDAGGTVLAMATGTPEGLQISLEELRTDVPSEDFSLIQGREAGQTAEQFLLAGASAAAAAVQESWKRRNRVTFGGTTQITALVPVASLKEWLAVKNRLDDVPLIDRLDLQAITRDRAQVTLYYSGAQRQLELAISQHDLALSQQNGVWIIQLRGAAAAASAAAPPATTPGGEPEAAPAEAVPQ